MGVRSYELMKHYKPEVAIIVYKGDSESYGDTPFYLESHTINDAGQLMEGKPLQQDTLDNMVSVFFDDKKNNAQVKGMVPECLLSFITMPGGKYKMVWYKPAEVRFIHHAKALKISSGKSWVPPMVYSVNGNDFDIFALNSNTRPIEKTKLYRAPFFNINDDGDVCLGNARVQKPKDRTYSNLIKYWEDLFWLSNFTHVNGEEKVKGGKLEDVWRKLIASKTRKKWADLDILIADKKTIANIL